MPAKPFEIIVAGAGPVGMIAGLALAHDGWRVALAGPDADPEDRRTTALMAPALETLDRLGVGEAVADQAAPLKIMRIVDGSSRLVRSPTVTFRAGEIGEERFGLNVPNQALNAILKNAVEAEPRIARYRSPVETWRLDADAAHASLGDGLQMEARLVVAADGRNSLAREAAGLIARTTDLGQSALTLAFGHSRDHGFISTEFHTQSGPFTQVPLPGPRSSLVWVLSPAQAEEYLALDDGELSHRIETRMQSILGKVTVEPGRQVYPLATAAPSRVAERRVALVGEAAHVFPPIGAQGLNLGFRDVEDLVATAASHRQDPGADDALSDYVRRRRLDILTRSTAVNLLNRSLLTDMLPAQIARSAGLGLLGWSSSLRGLFMREGMRPGSGFRSLFRSSGEEVGR